MMPVAARPGQSIRSNECPDDHGFSPDGSQGGRPTGSDAGGIRLSTPISQEAGILCPWPVWCLAGNNVVALRQACFDVAPEVRHAAETALTEITGEDASSKTRAR